ncbi:GNAT family N-acetyltransferase [Bacillus sp. SCS-153A]|uniref:GNAT family N-acetyltransferase n=1 Tax=Rossellomorea sedimentorum TaxID=3115294 RepID=UPI00390661B5
MLTMYGERLFLKEIEEQDWEDIHDYALQEQTSQYQNWGPNTENETKDFVKKH